MVKYAMTMIFIHGAIAAGKLTVGRALASRTDFKLFHNHLTVDALLAVFPFGSPSFVALRDQIWIDVARRAAEDDVPLIFTFAPEPTVPADFASRLVSAVEHAGSTVIFVRLDVSPEHQASRIVQPSRAAYGKLTDLEVLRALEQEWAPLQALPADLVLDTGQLTPEESATRIVAFIEDHPQL